MALCKSATLYLEFVLALVLSVAELVLEQGGLKTWPIMPSRSIKPVSSASAASLGASTRTNSKLRKCPS